jgi:hypothetical protein
MEMVLALAVVIAVIIFGGLISVGNERQRKAIDGLSEQAVLWALQDLRLKRERLAREVRIDNPIGWLNRMVTKVCGYVYNLHVVETFEELPILICASGDEEKKIIFTPLSPSEVRILKRQKQSQLSRYADRNPLLSLPRRMTIYEFSALNCGILFDLELPLAWKGMTNQEMQDMERIWMYVSS